MSIVSSLQKIRTYNKDIRLLQGTEKPDTKAPAKKRPSVILKPSKDKAVNKKNHYEIFVNPRVEPITDTPKLLTAAESRTSPIDTAGIKVEKKQTNESRIKFNDTEPERKNVTQSASERAESRKPKIIIPHKNQETVETTKVKIESRKKDAQADISKHVHSVSNHPESIQTSGRRDVFEVGDENTKSATIVRDKKIEKRSVLSDIASGLRKWFLQIKNTYITPPKPTYTIDQSERKAGVVQDATSQTGTALTDYDSFAKRLREKYKDTNTNTESGETFIYETEPSLLPTLPDYKEKRTDIKDIEITPEKRANRETDTSTPNKLPETTNLVEESTTEETSQDSVTNSQDKKEQLDSIEKTAVETTESQTYKDPNTQETYNLPEEVPPDINSYLATQPADTKESDTDSEITSAETEEATDELSQPNTTEEAEEPVVLKTEEGSNESKVEEETEEKQPPKEGIIKRARNLVYETVQSILSNTTSEKESKVEEISNDSGVIPSSYHSLSETKQAELRINKLSLVVVGGLLILVLLVTLALTFFQTENTFEGGVTTINSSYLSNTPTQMLTLDQYDTSAERIQMIKDQLQNTSATLVQLSPVREENNDLLSTKETIELLNINTPSSLFNVSTEMYFISDPNGNLILLLTIDDRSQALGVMLQWEDSLIDDLSSLLSYVDTNGTFTDETIADKDIRSQIRGDGSQIVSYAVTDDFILITNSRSGLETVLKALD